MNASYRLSVDIGGTFTDGVLLNEQTGALAITKVLSTPDDQARGFLDALERLTAECGVTPDALRSILHATTVATNAVLERRGAAVALITTAGFRDVLEIGRQIRHELYNLQTEKPVPLAPRRLCFEVIERLDYQGAVLTPLDEESVVRAVDAARAAGAASIAICLLHSYRNPAHEQRVAALARERFPEATISLSSAVAPEIREYWRASTTVINAYVAPVVQRYLSGLTRSLAAGGYTAPLLIMQSSGGVASDVAVRERPVAMLESGPAAGVAAAAFFARLAGFADALSFDMGGTTAKAGLVLAGRPSVLPEFEAGSRHGSGAGLVRGSGYPVLTPVVDLVEISAGGGSIAWVDAGGLLRVGPQSAGADPGPACYGRGGTAPTVTDANLVLGRLNPANFLGGRLALDVAAARAAVAQVAGPLGPSAPPPVSWRSPTLP
jgi:N-methylhydantoinase A/oxoprolinase/acetone carboxylase beta subunit